MKQWHQSQAGSLLSNFQIRRTKSTV